jgi:hypothetical protein
MALASTQPLAGAGRGGLNAVYKKNNSVLVGQTALGTMAGTGWHSEAGPRVDLGPSYCGQDHANVL